MGRKKRIDWLEKTSIAKNPSTPADKLIELSNDDEIIVRESVAKNLKTPVEILTKLS